MRMLGSFGTKLLYNTRMVSTNSEYKGYEISSNNCGHFTTYGKKQTPQRRFVNRHCFETPQSVGDKIETQICSFKLFAGKEKNKTRWLNAAVNMRCQPRCLFAFSSGFIIFAR